MALPVSSARIASSGKAARSRPRISASARASISVTRLVGAPLKAIRRSPASSLSSSAPAARAASIARLRSGPNMPRRLPHNLGAGPRRRSLDKHGGVSEHGSSMPETTRREPRAPAATPPRRRQLARIRPGTLPGTLPPQDPEAAARRRVTVIAYTHDAVTETEGKTLEEALAAAGPGVRWINVDGADT